MKGVVFYKKKKIKTEHKQINKPKQIKRLKETKK